MTEHKPKERCCRSINRNILKMITCGILLFSTSEITCNNYITSPPLKDYVEVSPENPASSPETLFPPASESSLPFLFDPPPDTEGGDGPIGGDTVTPVEGNEAILYGLLLVSYVIYLKRKD